MFCFLAGWFGVAPSARADSGVPFWSQVAAATTSASPTVGDEPNGWVRSAAAEVEHGRYREAAAAYQASVERGPASADLYANLAEVLMADGRLTEAQARYRDAVAVALAEPTGERRPRSQDLALAYYGLGVALDRGGRATAAREMIARALALDPGGALLNLAATPGSDLFFVPEGDVYYYMGLAAEVDGRPVDAEADFREFLARRPTDRWAAGAAAHLVPAARVGQPGPPATGSGGGRMRAKARIVAVGTVQSSGGIPAPLVDAAWRAQPSLLDDCLEASAGKGSVRMSVDLTLDGRGRVSRVLVEAPALGKAFARCAEVAVKAQLRVVAPRGSKTTSVRTEVLIAFP